MSKSIYEEAFESLGRLIEQANARKLSNEIVVSRWDVARIRKIINQAQKQEKLLNKIKEIIYRPDDSYIASILKTSNRYYEIENLLKELENE